MWWERAFDHFPLHPAIRSAAGEKKIQLFVCISQQLCNPTRLLRSKSHSIQGELIPGKRVQDCSLKSYRNKKGDPITGLPHHICFGPDPEQSWKQVSLNKHRDTNKKNRKESNSIGINWFTEENHSQFPCSPPKKNPSSQRHLSNNMSMWVCAILWPQNAFIVARRCLNRLSF